MLRHAVKVVESIFEYSIWQQVDVHDMQFGFLKRRETTDAIFIVRQVQEKFRAKRKRFYFGFVIWKKLLIGFRKK